MPTASEADGAAAASRAEASSDESTGVPSGELRRRREAAMRLQRRWRRHARAAGWQTRIEREWSGTRARRLGSLDAHVRFLQHVFRRGRELRPGCWRRGGMRGLMIALRLTRSYRCGGGANLATDGEIEAQRARGEAVLDWYAQYPRLLRRLMSGQTPAVVDDFCGGGGASDGVRRAGGVAHGIDSVVQDEFVRRFGAESFTRGDGVSWAVVAKVLKRARAVGGMASPPCKFYSTARVRGEARAPPLIEQTRDMLDALFEYWVIENVLGARAHLAEHAVELRGAWFGLRVDRPRLFEASFPIHVDEWLREPGEVLRARCCLGARRRWRRLDPFGRPERRPCCGGNTFAVQGTTPWRCTAAQCAEAMGVDEGHMEYERLAQAIPPAYSQLVFSQMCMAIARERFGAPAITYDDMVREPTRTRRLLAHWLRGAGGESPAAGLELVAAGPKAARDATTAAAEGGVVSGGGVSDAERKPATSGGGMRASEPVLTGREAAAASVGGGSSMGGGASDVARKPTASAGGKMALGLAAASVGTAAIVEGGGSSSECGSVRGAVGTAAAIGGGGWSISINGVRGAVGTAAASAGGGSSSGIGVGDAVRKPGALSGGKMSSRLAAASMGAATASVGGGSSSSTGVGDTVCKPAASGGGIVASEFAAASVGVAAAHVGGGSSSSIGVGGALLKPAALSGSKMSSGLAAASMGAATACVGGGSSSSTGVGDAVCKPAASGGGKTTLGLAAASVCTTAASLGGGGSSECGSVRGAVGTAAAIEGGGWSISSRGSSGVRGAVGKAASSMGGGVSFGGGVRDAARKPAASGGGTMVSELAVASMEAATAIEGGGSRMDAGGARGRRRRGGASLRRHRASRRRRRRALGEGVVAGSQLLASAPSSPTCSAAPEVICQRGGRQDEAEARTALAVGEQGVGLLSGCWAESRVWRVLGSSEVPIWRMGGGEVLRAMEQSQATASVVPPLFAWLPWAEAHERWAREGTMAASGPSVPITTVGESLSPAAAGAEDGVASMNWRSIGESEWREAYYSHAGGYDQQWVEAGAPRWLEAMTSGARSLDDESICVEALSGRNTYVEVSATRLWAALPELRRALREGTMGTRLTVAATAGGVRELRCAGFEVLRHVAAGSAAVGSDGVLTTLDEQRTLMVAGRRRGAARESRLDHEAVGHGLDPRDRGVGVEPSSEKAARSWRPMVHEPSRWVGKGLPAAVEQLMTEGARVEVEVEIGFFEVPQYPWPSAQALTEGILECDRHLAIGALEYVPASEVAGVQATRQIHPWTVVAQGPDKWRACLDMSVALNRGVRSMPFGLPTVWDVRRVVKLTSCFAKVDCRDGFFSVPIHVGSRNRFVMRHPGTGRLMRCARLPFGFVDSPRLFCSVTEALADELRRRVAGMAIHVFCYVDDYLIIGDDEAATARGLAMLEALLAEFGIESAPHKQRGPSRVIEFLGLLLCNVEGARCVALTEGRQRRLREMIDSWQQQRPASGGRLVVEPKELASLLGHLVFASQCVPGGRTYMQAMLSSFAGLEIDWARGRVRPTGGSGWGRHRVSDGFFRDLEWWSDHLERRNCVPLREPPHGAAAITGTDASGWGTGQLAWLDGAREETQLQFTAAEQRRPINWRELLGIVRVVQVYGARLAGRLVLIETDNLAAKGAAAKLSSSAEDMQELVRRLLELCEEHDITLRLTHTPGVKLDRPDQTSRGDPAEEPRARLTAAAFEPLASRFGPFTEVLGAERRHQQPARGGGSVGDEGDAANESGALRGGETVTARLWLHPSHTTVGSTLRLVGERLSEAGTTRVSGVVIVPHDEGAAWWKLTRHFQVVGSLAAGGKHLEVNRLGRWEHTAARRASLVLAFPRAAEQRARPMLPTMRDGEGARGGARPLLPMTGSFVYEPNTGDGAAGRLLQVASAAAGVVSGAELLVGCADRRGRATAWRLDEAMAALGGATSAATARLSAGRLWLVDHLVREEAAPTRWRPRGDGPRRWVFDVERAELEVQMAAWAADGQAQQQHAWAAGLLSEATAEGGDESAEAALAAANASADEAMAARRHVTVATRQGTAGMQGRAPRALLDVEAVQECRYRGTRCCGCGGGFAVGERVGGGGGGFVHRRMSCWQAAEQALRSLTQAGGAAVGAGGGEAVDAAEAARAHSVWARLEREFALSEGRADVAAGGLLLPRHSRAAFMSFVEWMASDAERAPSLVHVRLASRTFRAQTQLDDWCADGEVASMLRRLGGAD